MPQGYLAAIKNIFFPSLCLSCEKRINQGRLCLMCQEKIVFLHPPLCRYCSKPLSSNTTGLCRQCYGKIYPYCNVISITAYQEPIVSLIHLFKYKNYDYLANYLCSLMTKHLSTIGFNPCGYDFITAVPMHKDKLKMRGYNQAEILAKQLSNYFKIPLGNDIICDINIRPSQTKLTPTKRLENVKGAFVVKKGVKNKKIIIVDDVFTTGATVLNCAQALRNSGAEAPTVITLAKTINMV